MGELLLSGVTARKRWRRDGDIEEGSSRFPEESDVLGVFGIYMLEGWALRVRERWVTLVYARILELLSFEELKGRGST